MCWCRFRRQVAEGSRGFQSVLCSCGVKFRKVVCAGVGGSGGFRCLLVQEVVEGSSVCWCRFRRQVPEGPEGSGRFAEGSGEFQSGRFWRVPEFRRVGTGGRVRKVPESYGVACCLATLTGAAMWLFGTPFGDDIVHMGKTTEQKNGAHVVKRGIRNCCWGYHQSLFNLKLHKVTDFLAMRSFCFRFGSSIPSFSKTRLNQKRQRLRQAMDAALPLTVIANPECRQRQCGMTATTLRDKQYVATSGTNQRLNTDEAGWTFLKDMNFFDFEVVWRQSPLGIERMWKVWKETSKPHEVSKLFLNWKNSPAVQMMR